MPARNFEGAGIGDGNVPVKTERYDNAQSDVNQEAHGGCAADVIVLPNHFVVPSLVWIR